MRRLFLVAATALAATVLLLASLQLLDRFAILAVEVLFLVRTTLEGIVFARHVHSPELLLSYLLQRALNAHACAQFSQIMCQCGKTVLT